VLTRKPRFSPEAELERNIIDLFSGRGMFVKSQVPCPAGRADIVTKNSIIECKDKLTRPTLQQAMGQLSLYRPHLNPSARLAIVCNSSRVPHMHRFARKSGVEVFEWPEFKQKIDLIMCNPPYWVPPKK
jgi:hypothetical protein